MADVVARYDPLSIHERITVSAALIIALEWLFEGPRATLIAHLQAALPLLRKEPDFDDFAAAIRDVIAATDHQSRMRANMALTRALRPIVSRDLHHALRNS